MYIQSQVMKTQLGEAASSFGSTETVTHNPNHDAFSQQLTKELCHDVQTPPTPSRSPKKWLQSTPTDR
jgi:hypothetical protein